MVTIVTDNGGPFRSLDFELFIASHPELRHVRTRVKSPGQNGSRERGFGTLKYERLFLDEIPDALTLVERAEDYRVEYNTERPHETIAPGTGPSRSTSGEPARPSPPLNKKKSCQLLDAGHTFEFFTLLSTTLLTAPWWSRRWRELGRIALVVGVLFVAVLLYAFISLLAHAPPHLHFHDAEVSRGFVAMPLGTALFAMCSGFGFVLAAERHLRLKILATAGAASLIVAFIGWPFQAAYRNYSRLATSQGGAAIIHVAFLLIAAFGLTQLLRGIRPKVSMATTIAALIVIVATQSRGALLNVGAWLVLVVVGWLISHPKELKRLWPLGAALVAGLVALPLLPGAARVFELFDPKRATNAQTALAWWSDEPSTILFGTGPGQVWPWYAYESGAFAMPGGAYYEMAPTPYGQILLTPHSTPLALLVELGIPGALLGLVIGLALLLGWWRSRHALPRLVLASAVLASLVAFLVDTYLIRNFGISLWWWATIATVSTWQRHSSSA